MLQEEYTICDSSSNSSRISSSSMKCIIERLKTHKNRNSTNVNYLCVWRKFNNFLIKLDKKPSLWEDRIALFGAFLVNQGIQSSTLRSYYSAIKSILQDDGVKISEDRILLNMLVKSCKTVNDCIRVRLPIQIRLLEILLFELQRFYSKQPYLETMYKTIFLLAYYGLFRIGELTTGQHPVKAKDVHIGQNKEKMLFILHSSKTHN